MPQVIPIVAGAIATGLTAAGSSLGTLTVLGVSIGVGQIAGAIVGILGAVASMLLTPSQKTPGAQSSREQQQSIREGAGTRVMSFGTVRKGPDAHLVYDTTNTGDFVRFLALNHGPIDGFVTHKLGAEDVTLDGSGFVNDSTDGKWNGQVRIETFLGDPDAAALASLVSDYGPWTVDHRARGIAGVYVRQVPVAATDSRARHLHGELPYNGVIRAAADIYDPRDLSTGWSDNAALILLWYLRHADGRNLPDAKIDFDAFSVAADVCDELVTLAAGGTEKRYRANGSIPLTEEPNVIIAKMLENMDAVPTFDSSGRVGIRIGPAAQSNLLAFTEDQVISTQFRAGQRAIDRKNRVVPVITSEDHNYQELSVPAWQDATAVAAVGPKPYRMDLPYCPNHTQAQRLAKKKFLRLQAEEVGTIVTDLSGFFAWPGTTITLDWDTAETDLPLRVISRELSEDGATVTLEVEALSPDYDVWNAEEKTLPDFPAVNGTGSLLAAPSGVTLSSTVVLGSQSSGQVAGLVEWTSPADDTVQAEVELSVAGAGTWFGGQTVAANNGEVTIGGVTDGVAYDARVRFIGAAGGFTDYTLAENVILQVAIAPLTAPVLTLTPSTILETETTTISGTAPDSIYNWKVEIWRGTSATFSAATLLTTLTPGQAQAFAVDDTLAQADTYYYFSRAVNTSDIAGTESAAAVLSVTGEA